MKSLCICIFDFYSIDFYKNPSFTIIVNLEIFYFSGIAKIYHQFYWQLTAINQKFRKKFSMNNPRFRRFTQIYNSFAYLTIIILERSINF